MNGYIGLDASNKFNDSGIGKDLLVLQSQGNFPLLTYVNSSMDKVICEVIATHNAMILADIQRNDDNFFRLASEFEVNARIPTNKSIMMYIDSQSYQLYPYIFALNLILDDNDEIDYSELDLSNYWNKGGLGSNPLKIGDCLKAYDLEYDIYTTCNDFQNNLNKCRGGIISFSFDLIRIHTYAIRYNPTESTGKYYRGYNRSNSQVLWDDPSVEENIRTDNNILVGYTIK